MRLFQIIHDGRIVFLAVDGYRCGMILAVTKIMLRRSHWPAHKSSISVVLDRRAGERYTRTRPPGRLSHHPWRVCCSWAGRSIPQLVRFVEHDRLPVQSGVPSVHFCAAYNIRRHKKNNIAGFGPRDISASLGAASRPILLSIMIEAAELVGRALGSICLRMRIAGVTAECFIFLLSDPTSAHHDQTASWLFTQTHFDHASITTRWPVAHFERDRQWRAASQI